MGNSLANLYGYCQVFTLILVDIGRFETEVVEISEEKQCSSPCMVINDFMWQIDTVQILIMKHDIELTWAGERFEYGLCK